MKAVPPNATPQSDGTLLGMEDKYIRSQGAAQCVQEEKSNALEWKQASATYMPGLWASKTQQGTAGCLPAGFHHEACI